MGSTSTDTMRFGGFLFWKQRWHYCDFLLVTMETSNYMTVLRCRKCRKCVVDSSCLLAVRPECVSDNINAVDGVATECRIWHLDSDNLPSWILASVLQAQWTSGKLICQHCGARLGGFNFINQPNCPCGQELTVHLCKSRLDLDCRRPTPPGKPAPESHIETPPVGATASGAVPPEATAKCECQPVNTALEAGPCEMDISITPVGTVLLPWRQESSVRHVTTGCQKASALDYGHGCGARTVLSRSFSEVQQECLRGSNISKSFPDSRLTALGRKGVSRRLSDRLQTHPLRETTFSSPQLESTAASQLQPAEWAETTCIQAVCALTRRRPSLTSTDEEEQTEEGSELTAPPRSLLSDRPMATNVEPPRLLKRERNRLKSQRRKQRRRERWIQSHLHEQAQSLVGEVTSNEEEDMAAAEREGLTCSVCLDLFFSPHMCQPCGHIFCEPCLRTLARNRPSSTPCPLCRTLITTVLFQKELSNITQTFYPKLYLSRKQNFQKASCARWPLPNSRKLFRIFHGLQQRHSHWRWGLGDYLGVVDMMHARQWRMSLGVLAYVCSINWVIGLFICLFLCYVFFTSD
ncbi:hypothetical protein GJAV_G00042880 [Gymnothorax javanicus]|nr:hypothetical protein GJAV_G00042880 [Gymnothorax javanicus]